MARVYLKIPKNGHTDLTYPLKVLQEITSEPEKIEYLVYSGMVDKTFSVTEDEIKLTPIDSEYVVDKKKKETFPLTTRMSKIAGILDCIIRFDEEASIAEKGVYFETIQKDLKKLIGG